MCMPSYNPFSVAMPYQNVKLALHLDWNTILPQKDKLFWKSWTVKWQNLVFSSYSKDHSKECIKRFYRGNMFFFEY